MRTADEDAARARSFSQYVLDSMALALLVGAVNGLLVGLASLGILGVIFGSAIGAFVALILWIPAVWVTWWLVVRYRAERLSPTSLVRWMTIVAALFGSMPAVVFGLPPAINRELSAKGVATLFALLTFGGLSGAWAGRKLGKLQLDR
jgi:uncharacterized membrane protein YuzA (DUF378 family)